MAVLNNKILWTSDLDNTLIYSYKKIYGDSVCVELMDGKESGKKLSFMSITSHKKLNDMVYNNENNLEFVPLTTRAVHQYKRIDLLCGRVPRYALVANGAILLKNGNIDKEWFEESKKYVNLVMDQLNKAIELLKEDKEIYMDIRFVDEVFVYTKSHTPIQTIEMLSKKLDNDKVYLDTVNDKVYVFPKQINKGFAIRRLKKIIESDLIVASGDSKFDYSMLMEADVKLIPNAGGLEKVMIDASISDKDSIEFGDFVVNNIENILKNM